MSSNPTSGVERGPSGPLFLALFLLLCAVSLFGADAPLSWRDSPEAYFATDAELRQWDHEVFSTSDAEKFIAVFRQKRGPQFQKDLQSRIAAADKNFGLNKVPGSRTARGRVFMLLGSPNEQRTHRGSGTGADSGPTAGSMQDNSLERGARVTYRWVYRKDRLPAAMGRSELIVDFQTDVSRGTQSIDNPGLVEGFLRRAAEYHSTAYIAQAVRTPLTPATAVATAGAATSATVDPLWQATPAPNGVIYTADTFTSATAKPFYAVNAFIPSGSSSDAESAQVVMLVRDASGRQVVSDRKTVQLSRYGSAARYVDVSHELAPGNYDATVAIYSADGANLLSSWRDSFEVPAAGTARTSKLFVTSAVTELEKQAPFDPFTFVATKYALRGDRQFAATEPITLFAAIDHPLRNPEPRLMQKLTFTKDGKPSFKTALEPAQLVQTGPDSYLFGLTFDPGTFKPGHYTVEVQLRDFNAAEGSDLRTKGYVLKNEFDVK